MTSTQPATGRDTSGMGDYFSVDELFALLARRKWPLLLSILAGALLGLLVAWMVPASWTATALVQIGQVGIASPSGPTSDAFGTPIEPASRAAERLRNRAFVRSLLQQMGLPATESGASPEAQLVRNSLSVVIPKNTDLLEIRVAGSSPEAAHKHATAVIAMLAAAHAQLAEPTLARLRGQLEHVNAQLNRALAKRQALVQSEAVDGRGVRASDRFAASVLLSQLVASNDQEIAVLRQQQLTLQEQLSPRRTFATALLTDIDVPDRPSFPKRSLFALAGAGLALLVALAWLLARGPRHP